MRRNRILYLILTIITIILGLLSRKVQGLPQIIEISQLYHAPWIDSIRATTLGGLILGFGFLWSDLICYTVGIVIGAIIDKIINN